MLSATTPATSIIKKTIIDAVVAGCIRIKTIRAYLEREGIVCSDEKLKAIMASLIAAGKLLHTVKDGWSVPNNF